MGIRDIQIKKKSELCPGNFEEANLYNWPGSVKGYKKDGKYFQGSSIFGKAITAK